MPKKSRRKFNKKSRSLVAGLRLNRASLVLALAALSAAGLYWVWQASASSTFGAFPVASTREKITGKGWCYTNQSHCHHDYPAADIFVDPGTPVVAVTSGTVYTVRRFSSCSQSSSGERVAIKGVDGTYYAYYHMGPGTIPPGIDKGVAVTPGTVLGSVGPSACAQGTPPHLHFQMTKTPPPSCDGASCPDGAYYNPQPPLIEAFNRFYPPVPTFDRTWTEGEHRGTHGGGAAGTTLAGCYELHSICHSNGELRDPGTGAADVYWLSHAGANGQSFVNFGPYITLPAVPAEATDNVRYEACANMRAPGGRTTQVLMELTENSGRNQLRGEIKDVAFAGSINGEFFTYTDYCIEFRPPAREMHDVELRMKVLSPRDNYYVIGIRSVRIRLKEYVPPGSVGDNLQEPRVPDAGQLLQ